MALRTTGPFLPGDTDHDDSHAEIHELLAQHDGVVNAAAYATLADAHTALPAGGGKIYVPPNHQITISSTVTITKPCAIILGHGAQLIHGGTTGFFNMISVSSAVDAFALVGDGSGILDGRYGAGRTGGGPSLLLNGCSNAWVSGLRFQNHPDGAIALEGVTNSWIRNNRFTNGGTLGVKYGGQNRAGLLDGNYFDTYQNSCVFFDQPGAGNTQLDMTVSNNKFRNTQRSGSAGRAAIQTFGNGASSENWFQRFKILHNDVFNSTQPGGAANLVGLGFDQLGDSLVQGNHVTNVITGGSEGIIVNGPRNKICSNHVRYQSAGGIGLLSYGGSGNLVIDCVVCCNTIEGNNTASGQGINYVATNAAGNAVSGLLITGNRCFKNGYGIQTYNDGGTLAGSNNFIVANNLTGNITGATLFVANSGQTLTANLP